jgi:FKBP-type peptidyl-prolyl cis-trans isomerase
MARRFPIGIRVKDLKVGSGAVATKGKVALLHYDCFLPRGDKVDSSRKGPYPFQFEIGQRRAFPGIEYGIVGMAAGGLRSVRVSPQLTYHEQEVLANLPPNVALRYEIELLRVADRWDNSYGEDPLFDSGG